MIENILFTFDMFILVHSIDLSCCCLMVMLNYVSTEVDLTTDDSWITIETDSVLKILVNFKIVFK